MARSKPKRRPRCGQCRAPMAHLDGFAAWEAANQAGELVTQLFRCNGDRLFVNADAHGGSIRAEVLDERGAPVAGFEAEACQTVSTDTLVDKNSGWIQWKNPANLRQLAGKQIQLRFVLQNARLYSFRVADEKTMNLPVPRATDR